MPQQAAGRKRLNSPPPHFHTHTHSQQQRQRRRCDSPAPTMAKIFVGNLPMDVRERELEKLFDRYGRIRDIDIKTPGRPPAVR
jgi:RNA recognition motif-containing protein